MANSTHTPFSEKLPALSLEGNNTIKTSAELGVSLHAQRGSICYSIFQLVLLEPCKSSFDKALGDHSKNKLAMYDQVTKEVEMSGYVQLYPQYVHLLGQICWAS